MLFQIISWGRRGELVLLWFFFFRVVYKYILENSENCMLFIILPFILCFFFKIFSVLRIKPRAFHMLGKDSIIMLQPQPWNFFFLKTIQCLKHLKILVNIVFRSDVHILKVNLTFREKNVLVWQEDLTFDANLCCSVRHSLCQPPLFQIETTLKLVFTCFWKISYFLSNCSGLFISWFIFIS